MNDRLAENRTDSQMPPDFPDGSRGLEFSGRVCWKCGSAYDSSVDMCPLCEVSLVSIGEAPPTDPLIGQLFDGRYLIERKLGEGGMGIVYAARQKDFDRVVALKILRTSLVTNKDIRRRFMYEARTISNLRHPNAVRLYDFGQSPTGNVYMVMELLVGESLADRLTYSFVTYRQIFDMLIPICGVLAEAHNNGVIHRDLKPENIYIGLIEGQPEFYKLLDFGIAKHLESGGTTQSGTLWGTPAYMAPEQIQGNPVSSASDIYAIGIMLFELISGRLPFYADTQVALAMKHLTVPVRPLRSIPGLERVPQALDTLIQLAVQKQPERRPNSMERFVEQLSTIRERCFDNETLDRIPAADIDSGSFDRWLREEEDLKSGHGLLSTGPSVNEIDIDGPLDDLADMISRVSDTPFPDIEIVEDYDISNTHTSPFGSRVGSRREVASEFPRSNGGTRLLPAAVVAPPLPSHARTHTHSVEEHTQNGLNAAFHNAEITKLFSQEEAAAVVRFTKRLDGIAGASQLKPKGAPSINFRRRTHSQLLSVELRDRQMTPMRPLEQEGAALHDIDLRPTADYTSKGYEAVRHELSDVVEFDELPRLPIEGNEETLITGLATSTSAGQKSLRKVTYVGIGVVSLTVLLLVGILTVSLFRGGDEPRAESQSPGAAGETTGSLLAAPQVNSNSHSDAVGRSKEVSEEVGRMAQGVAVEVEAETHLSKIARDQAVQMGAIVGVGVRESLERVVRGKKAKSRSATVRKKAKRTKSRRKPTSNKKEQTSDRAKKLLQGTF